MLYNDLSAIVDRVCLRVSFERGCWGGEVFSHFHRGVRLHEEDESRNSNKHDGDVGKKKISSNI